MFVFVSVFVFVFVFVFVMYLSFSVTPVSEISRRVTVARDSLQLVARALILWGGKTRHLILWGGSQRNMEVLQPFFTAAPCQLLELEWKEAGGGVWGRTKVICTLGGGLGGLRGLGGLGGKNGVPDLENTWSFPVWGHRGRHQQHQVINIQWPADVHIRGW